MPHDSRTCVYWNRLQSLVSPGSAHLGCAGRALLHGQQMTVRKRYEAMRDALNATGRPILFSMCEWGVSSPWEYGQGGGTNSFRTTRRT